MGFPISNPPDHFLRISSRAELALWLGISDKILRYLLYVLPTSKKYKSFTISKRNGGRRPIDAPIDPLMRIQRQILRVIEKKAPPSGIAKGYVKGRSIFDHARLHRRKRFILLADIKDFFPSIHFGRVRGAFMKQPFSLPSAVATCLAQICCKDGALPQGAPTSSALSNLVCRQLDHKLIAYARRHRITVSRYADDICFSSNRPFPPDLVLLAGGVASPGKALTDIIETSGFRLNPKKFRQIDNSRRQLVTGLVVNKGVSVPRFWKRQLRALLHLSTRHGPKKSAEIATSWTRPPISRQGFFSLDNVIYGKATFAQSVDRRFNRKFSDALFRNYPAVRHLLPRPLGGMPFRVLSEGKTDLVHLEAAYEAFNQNGRYLDLRPKFENHIGPMSDIELQKTLDRLAGYSVQELTIGVFDADNPKLLKTMGLMPGHFARIGDSVYAVCLAPPTALVGQPICIELLYSRLELTQFTDSDRRIFLKDEFDSATGLSLDGKFQRSAPAAGSLIVGDEVKRVSDGYSSLLGKSDFAGLVASKRRPFQAMDFEGFAATFDIFRNVIRNYLR